MNLWNNLFNKFISPLVDDAVSQKIDEQKVRESATPNLDKIFYSQLQPISISTSKDGKKADTRYLSGVTYQVLRDFSKYYPVLRSCINYRKRQITQLSWDVTATKVIYDEKKKKESDIKREEIRELLKFPTGDENVSFREFLNRILEDLFVLDAVAIYKRLTKGGKIYGYLPIDASTIDIITNQDGTLPQPPEVAFIQRVGKKEIAKLTLNELIYKMLNPRTDSPYGLSPIESLIITVTTALKLSNYNLAYLTAGNIPEGLVELPKEIASDPDQLKAWQTAWDAMFSGDSRYQRKIKFLPEGMKWHPTKKIEDMTFERFEKWLLQITTSVMEVAPQAIGFQFDRGKGATESEWEIGKERGLYPTTLFLKEIFDHIIQKDYGYTDFEFIWTNINPTNRKEEAAVFDTLFRDGAISIDEWRIGEGMDPIGCGHLIMTPTGPIFVKDLVEASEAGMKPGVLTTTNNGTQNGGGAVQNPVVPANKPSGGTPVNKPVEVPPKKETPTKEEKIDFSSSDITEELKKWKRATINDFKKGTGFREFKTDILDARTQSLIRKGISSAKCREDIDDLFDPFISQQNTILNAVMKLYDDISDIKND